MFFEPPYLWHRLWCVGLIAGFSQITGEGMETSFPARRLLSALQRKTGRGRTALFLCAVIARWIFPAGIFVRKVWGFAERERGVMGQYARMMAVGSVLAVLFFVLSLSVGRFYVPFDQVCAILASNFIELPITWDASMYNVVMVIRLPRVLGDILVGVALAVSGAAYQGVFRNDLVSPDLLGVSQGASVGACLAILAHLTLGGTAGAAFLGGIAAVTMTLMLPKLVQSRSRIVLVLCGIIVSGFMAAVIGLLKYLADPDTELADIVYWQLGSLAKVSWDNLLYVTPIIVLTLAGLLAMRWRMNVLSLSDQEAASLGVNVQRERLAVIALATLLTASAVCLSGTIGWIGLILPHLARMLVGGNHAQLLPATAVLAASFLMLADLLARTLTSAEVPLGILCGFVGTPFFAWILYRQRRYF